MRNYPTRKGHNIIIICTKDAQNRSNWCMCNKEEDSLFTKDTTADFMLFLIILCPLLRDFTVFTHKTCRIQFAIHFQS